MTAMRPELNIALLSAKIPESHSEQKSFLQDNLKFGGLLNGLKPQRFHFSFQTENPDDKAKAMAILSQSGMVWDDQYLLYSGNQPTQDLQQADSIGFVADKAVASQLATAGLEVDKKFHPKNWADKVGKAYNDYVDQALSEVMDLPTPQAHPGRGRI